MNLWQTIIGSIILLGVLSMPYVVLIALASYMGLPLSETLLQEPMTMEYPLRYLGAVPMERQMLVVYYMVPHGVRLRVWVLGLCIPIPWEPTTTKLAAVYAARAGSPLMVQVVLLGTTPLDKLNEDTTA